MLKRLQPNSWWSRCLWIVASYVVAADFLPNTLLILINSAGYLPYSDRPGPGWQMPHLPTSSELQFFLGFCVLLLKATAFYGLIFGAAGWVLGFCSLPRWALRVLAAPSAVLACALIMAAGGWLIAISPLGVYLAAGCGLLWGLFVFPVLVPRMNHILPVIARIALPLTMLAAAAFWLVRPFLPDPYLTNGKIEVIRQSTVGVDLSKIDLSYVSQSIAREVKGIGKYVSVQRMQFETDNSNQLRVLVIIDDERAIPHTFQLPRAGDVIFEQSRGNWSETRSDKRNSKLSLELTLVGTNDIRLQLQGPCCSSMNATFAPYH